MTSLFDKNYLFNQSGVVPYRIAGNEVEVLLITSRRRKRWIIPKGIVEPDLSPAESAAKEALEEAGVTGILHPDEIGEYAYEKWGGVCHVKVFLLQVTQVLDSWEESFLRDRRWLSLPDAIELIEERDLQNILRSISRIIFNY
ncbi:NUDIX hydrolase [bacterium]|nr:MAG: NUDIX domain-containing protein [candidate division KSB1 bacterium]MCE7942192.1 NUDIX domain-containing protein [Chlorobi bacterium CHB1]MCL4709162.1 NUDIX hydrolase [bacterium]MDL1875668.1 NUDIX hydrolase [Cytophagia bacterium CHB2]MBC6948731.1 NUDIX domain-containing protein [candidate division KSB1 bacterium]